MKTFGKSFVCVFHIDFLKNFVHKTRAELIYQESNFKKVLRFTSSLRYGILTFFNIIHFPQKQ